MFIGLDNCDLNKICYSGQCFRWLQTDDNEYEVIAYDRLVRFTQLKNGIDVSCDEEEWNNIWRKYLDLDTDYDKIKNIIESSDDIYMKESYNVSSGIRILRQELFETIISYLISQNNNIKRIKKSIGLICEKAAVPVINSDREGKYRFPKPEEIDLEFFNDNSLGLGYRNEYLARMYDFVKNNPEWLQSLRQMNNDEAMVELKSHIGIGNKVASCICLYGLHHVDAFPIDTHIKQILNTHYPNGFDFDRYSGVAGIVQQYMFYNKIK